MNPWKNARETGALWLTKMPRCTRIMMLYCTEGCRKAVFLARNSLWLRGCSSVAERRLPKPIMWVRFPSPAPNVSHELAPPVFMRAEGRSPEWASTKHFGGRSLNGKGKI